MAHIDPVDRVATENYFKVLTENENISHMKTDTMARSRFDKAPEIGAEGSPIRNKKTAGNRLPVNLDLMMDSPEAAMRKLQLPPQTLYLIDKVVRAKALYGPIGVDNSEFINIEMERDLRKRNRYIAGLYGEKPPTDEGGEDEEDRDEEGLTGEERGNLENEKLLQRLYKAAQNEINDGKEEKVHFAPEMNERDEAAMSGLNKALID